MSSADGKTTSFPPQISEITALSFMKNLQQKGFRQEPSHLLALGIKNSSGPNFDTITKHVLLTARDIFNKLSLGQVDINENLQNQAVSETIQSIQNNGINLEGTKEVRSAINDFIGIALDAFELSQVYYGSAA